MSSLWIVDIRRLYNSRALDSRLELGADIFNLFDNQNAIRNQELLAGTRTATSLATVLDSPRSGVGCPTDC